MTALADAVVVGGGPAGAAAAVAARRCNASVTLVAARAAHGA
jgi:thioredoxin reductase